MSIVLEGLIKRFGDLVVVNRVDLEVLDGELFVLLGGSGSGKSSLLRLIAGLSTVDAGRISLHGRDVTQLPPQQRGIGFVFQNYSLFRHMTVAQNIEFGLKLRRVSAAERRSRSEELLEMVSLSGLGERYPDQLSGGQQQRVALARALAYQPEVLLLDEPFGALDVKIRAQLRRSLKEIQQKLQVTSILVTHDQEEAFELADRIGVIERGSLLEVGRPEELYRRPHSQFVATFVGSANVVVGRMDGGKIRLGQVLLPLPEATPPHLDGAPVRVLTRPENVVLSATEPRGVESLGRGQVEDASFSGSLRRVRVIVPALRGARGVSPTPQYGHGDLRLDAVLTSDSDLDLSPGRELWIGLNGYQLLERTGLKTLLALEPMQSGAQALEFGEIFAARVDAPVTLVTVLGPGEGADPVVAWHGKLQERFPGLKVSSLVRRGRLHSEIVREVQEGRHELVLLGSFGSLARQVLAAGGLPVLIGRRRERLARVLVCTAGGEPGKEVVWMAGRIGRRARTAVTVLHVVEPGASPERRRRVENHLAQAQSSLASMGVEVATMLREAADPAELILSQGGSGDYDLLIAGAPGDGRAVQRDLASRLTAGPLPVLLVPMPKG